MRLGVKGTRHIVPAVQPGIGYRVFPLAMPDGAADLAFADLDENLVPMGRVPQQGMPLHLVRHVDPGSIQQGRWQINQRRVAVDRPPSGKAGAMKHGRHPDRGLMARSLVFGVPGLEVTAMVRGKQQDRVVQLPQRNQGIDDAPECFVEPGHHPHISVVVLPCGPPQGSPDPAGRMSRARPSASRTRPGPGNCHAGSGGGAPGTTETERTGRRGADRGIGSPRRSGHRPGSRATSDGRHPCQTGRFHRARTSSPECWRPASSRNRPADRG